MLKKVGVILIATSALVAIVILSVIPRRLGFWGEGDGSTLHFVAYSIISALVVWVLVLFRSRLDVAVMIAFTHVAFIGAALEIVQVFIPTRSAEISDLVSDILGSGVGTILAAVGVYGRRNGNTRSI